MNIKEFDKKYRNKGGVKMLETMKDNLIAQKNIAKHFEVSQERVRQWMVELFGEKYDPRPARREEAIAKMVKFYHETSMQEFHHAFKGSAYYRKALEIIDKTIV